jgi:hypothetical protein
MGSGPRGNAQRLRMTWHRRTCSSLTTQQDLCLLSERYALSDGILGYMPHSASPSRSWRIRKYIINLEPVRALQSPVVQLRLQDDIVQRAIRENKMDLRFVVGVFKCLSNDGKHWGQPSTASYHSDFGSQPWSVQERSTRSLDANSVPNLHLTEEMGYFPELIGLLYRSAKERGTVQREKRVLLQQYQSDPCSSRSREYNCARVLCLQSQRTRKCVGLLGPQAGRSVSEVRIGT